MCLPIFLWLIYWCTCPHPTEHSAVFWPKMARLLCPTLPIHPFLPWVTFFCFLRWKKTPQRETFCWWLRGETKNSRSSKRHQNISKTVLSSVKNVSICLLNKQRVLWRWLKFKHIRTQFIINKFWVFCSTLPHIFQKYLNKSVWPYS